MALVVFLARSSSAPAQPTQNRYSTSGPSVPSATGTSKSSSSAQASRAVSAHAPRVALVLQVLQHPRGLGRERGLDEDLVTAHPVDVVDVLDIDRAFLDARPAVGARPDDVGVDHPVLGLRADQRAAGLELHRVRELLPGLVAVGQEVGGLGQGVVTQVQDHLLGRQRLARGPRRALGLAPPALGAGGHVQQALPGEVLDLPQPEHVGVRVGLLEVQHLPVAAHRLQPAQRVRAAGEQHVERRGDDVQVLGVGQEDQEPQHHRHLGQQEHGLDHLVRPDAQRRQPVARRSARRTPRGRRGTRRC